MKDEPNPFQPPDAEQMGRYSPSKDPSIEDEPHRLDDEFLPHADVHESQPNGVPDELVHTVWDEPAISSTFAKTVF